MAGLTVAAVALPLALAFGVSSSGATAAAGMITAIVAGIVIGSLSGGFYQISGPTGAMAAILMSIAAVHGMQGIFYWPPFWREFSCFWQGIFAFRELDFFYSVTGHYRVYFRNCYYYCVGAA